jgi:hypothetical protein
MPRKVVDKMIQEEKRVVVPEVIINHNDDNTGLDILSRFGWGFKRKR